MAKRKGDLITAEKLQEEYLYVGLKLTPQQHLDIFSIAELQCRPESAIMYPDTAKRAAFLNLTLPEYNMLRRTPEYQKALKDVTVLLASEGTAQTVHNLIEWAKAGDTNAFKILAKLGGMVQTAPGVQVNTQVNVTLEQGLEGLVAEKRAKVIDAG